MKADIFIPTANNLQALQECLMSLTRQTYKKYRVIVIAIKRNSAVEKLLRTYSSLDITYSIQSGPGLVRAAQDAYKLSKGDIFIRIDDDVVLEPDWLQNIVEIFSRDTTVGGVTGPTLTSVKGRQSRDLFLFFEKAEHSKNPFMKTLYHLYIGYIYEYRLYDIGRFLRSGAFTLGSNFADSTNLKHPIEVDNLEACNMAIRTTILKKYTGFDMTFNRGLGEYHEADIAYKIKQAGYRVLFSPVVRLQHKVETTETVSKARADAYYRISNFIIFYRRHIRIRNSDYFARFLTNVALQNIYYCYKFITTGDIRQLGALPGTIHGFLSNKT